MLTVVIQAGGQSSRMGTDKALKLFLGRPLIQRVIDRLAPIADEVIVTTNRPADYGFLNPSGEAAQPLRLISDLKPGRGPLGGLYTAIASAKSPFVAVVACDMPFASKMLLEGAQQLLAQEDADVVIAKTEEGYEPFHAVYRAATCVPAIEAAMAADQMKVVVWFPQVKVHILSAQEVQSFDPTGLCFWNLNTPDEFARAEKIASEQ